MSMNIIRQFLAMSLLIYAYKHINSNSVIKFIISILIASLFHRTALLFLPLYFIPWKLIHINRIFWLTLFLTSLLVSQANTFLNISYDMIYILSEYIPFFDIYIHYLYSRYFEIQIQETTGIVVVFKNILFIFVLYYCKNIIKKYPESKPYFVTYFTGVILYNIFFNILIMERVVEYFLFVRPFILSLVIYKVWNKQKNMVEMLVIFGIILIYFAIYFRTILIYPYQYSF
jgi:transmembrane protein EpsG